MGTIEFAEHVVSRNRSSCGTCRSFRKSQERNCQMPGPITLSMNPDRKSLTFSFRSRFGVARKLSLPAAEAGHLIQELGFARLTMIPPQLFASTSADTPPTTRNPSVQVVAGTSGSFMLSLLDARYGWLGFQMRTQSWQALAKQVADIVGETDSRSSTPR